MKIGYEYMVGYADAMRNASQELSQQMSYMTEEEVDANKKFFITLRHWSEAADQAVTAAKRSRDKDKRR
jgi:hypothetical protein